ncbi:phage tail assembly chaperone [Serratia aquatilis]|uniref:Phage tail assembly chaperone n=1 Tax=Serratia aquatilis TaxID=1737515 RepID=A0ABV6EI43_9GAMM
MEFELKDNHYRVAKMDVFAQFRLSRKLLPMLMGVIGDPKNIKNGGTSMETLLPKMAEVISSMSDEDCNAVIYPCLAVVSRQNGKTWSPVFSQDVLMFDDIDMMDMLQIVGRVVGDALGSFLPTAPANGMDILPAG